MINIVMWLKEEKNKEKISMACARNSIHIVESEFENISDFLTIFSELDTNIDVLVISHEMLAETDKGYMSSLLLRGDNSLKVIAGTRFLGLLKLKDTVYVAKFG